MSNVKELTLVRHAPSAYNNDKAQRQQDPLYREFRRAFEADRTSSETHDLAANLMENFVPKTGDHDTPLAEGAAKQAEEMASNLKEKISVPHVIYVSPYKRTLDTLEAMKVGWRDLEQTQVIQEERLREKEHGRILRYPEWRLFQAMNPEDLKDRMIQGPYWYRFPGGESVPDVRERVRSWMDTVKARYSGKNVLAVTHHITILAALANHFQWNADQFVQKDNTDKPANTSVTIFKGIEGNPEEEDLNLDQYNLILYR